MNDAGQQRTAVAPPRARIETLESLREHLQWAVELEHATLPPYLCALYSLDPERNPDAVQVVGSVFVEEMIHLALAANLLNAVGGRPRLDTPEMLPRHPRRLPHGDRSLELSLVPFGPEALEMFLRLEQPAPPGAPAEGDDYETIGQFYDAIEQGLRHLCAELGEQEVFSGDPARQVTADHFSHTAGRLIRVDDLDSALAALEEIVEQGEGTARGEVWDGDQDIFHPDRDEVAHYYRFEELKLGRRYRRGDTPRSGPTGEAVAVDFGGVHPMRRNPRLADHPAGQPDPHRPGRVQPHLLRAAPVAGAGVQRQPEDCSGPRSGTMYALKAQAQSLMRDARRRRRARPARPSSTSNPNSADEPGRADPPQALRRVPESSRREPMPSLAKTLWRCHSTVRGLRNNSAPISGFVRPSAASRAICASCAVNSSRASTDRLRSVSPVATSSRRARSAKASAPMSVSMSYADLRWLRASRRRFSRRSHSPYSKLSAGVLDAHASPAEPLDGLDVVALGRVTLAHLCARSGFDSQCPFGAAGARGPSQQLECIRCAVGVAASRRGLDEFHQRPGGEAELVGVPGSSLCCCSWLPGTAPNRCGGRPIE